MHDIKSIRDDPQAFDEGLKRRGLAPMSGDVLKADVELRAVLTKLQQAQARRNEASKLIGHAKAKKDEAQASALMAEVAGLKDEIQKGEEEERRLKEQLDKKLAEIPNLPAADVPVGPDESANVELRRWSEKPGIPFKPKEHYELGEGVGQMDFEAAARMSGARFVVLKKGLARLERAIAQFMLDLHTEQFGYTEVSPPLLVRDHAMFGTGQLPKFKDDLFLALSIKEGAAPAKIIPAIELTESLDSVVRTLGDMQAQYERWATNYLLIPTAEVPLTNLVREQILDEKQLPLRFTACTPCFRAEAGAAGKDTRGMIRLHQFSKVELVSITTPEQSAEEHERMTDAAQEVLKRLSLHHRVIVLSTGDMGFAAKKTYDIEVWLPGQDAFREISSCSNCGDFQARRMNARYRPQAEKATRFVHTLNGSGLAVGRTLVAVMENYQQADGSILIPEALRPYMGSLDRIAP
ncbi:MAG: seryl-tRNA synthetase [Alphaproteobacteria bacterium]|nr:seryl-tRNA synthetase [Alphaproteobacteria bacterium]